MKKLSSRVVPPFQVTLLALLAAWSIARLPAAIAAPATGNVILHLTPLAAVPSHRLGDVFGLSYTFEAFTADGQPLTQNFNQNVAISFRYDPAELLQRGLNLDRIHPAYFSITTDRWTLPDSFVVDEDRVITMEIDFFTTMGLVDAPTDVANQMYLPLIHR
jgi:hypothetical protein